MKKNNKEKLLLNINENGFLYKIKKLFRNLFIKGEVEKKADNQIETTKNNKYSIEESEFLKSIKNIENEETKLLKLQKQYRSREITEENLTIKQIILLNKLYDQQIEILKKSIETKKRLLKHRKSMI